MSDTERPELDILVLVARRYRTIALFVIAGIAAGVLYLAVANQWYAAQLTVVPSQRSRDSAALSLVAKLPVAFDSMSTDVQRIQAVLTSTSVTDEVIKKFKLQERYGKDHLEHARKELWEHCGATVDRKSGVVTLTCEDTDPELAMQMTSYFGDVGNSVFGRVSASSAREERKFLEAQVSKARQDVDSSSKKLREFQEGHNVVDLPEQSKATISAMATIQGQLMSKQIELSYLSSFSARTESGVVQLQQQISIMEAKLQQLQNARVPSGSAADSFFPTAMNVPALRFQLEQLLRDQKIHETVFFLMTERFEMAKVDEARDTSTFQILDHPTLPTYRIRPKRLRIGIIALLASLALAGAVIVIPAWWRHRIARS